MLKEIARHKSRCEVRTIMCDAYILCIHLYLMIHSYSHVFYKPKLFIRGLVRTQKTTLKLRLWKYTVQKNPKSFSSNTLQTMHKVLIYTYAFLPNILPKCFIFYESLLELKKHTVFNTEIFRHCSKIVRAKEQWILHAYSTYLVRRASMFNTVYYLFFYAIVFQIIRLDSIPAWDRSECTNRIDGEMLREYTTL